jgi:hypothetical protein
MWVARILYQSAQGGRTLARFSHAAQAPVLRVGVGLKR